VWVSYATLYHTDGEHRRKGRQQQRNADAMTNEQQQIFEFEIFTDFQFLNKK